MVGCDGCGDWFHDVCVNYGPDSCADLERHQLLCAPDEPWSCSCEWYCNACSISVLDSGSETSGSSPDEPTSQDFDFISSSPASAASQE